MSVPRALLIVLALLQATGVADLIRRETCAAECRNDGCDDDCTPGDGSACPCHCPSAPSIAPPPLASVKLAPADARVIDFERAERTHATPEPREILHVPRRVV